jgi:hypothetical protein
VSQLKLWIREWDARHLDRNAVKEEVKKEVKEEREVKQQVNEEIAEEEEKDEATDDDQQVKDETGAGSCEFSEDDQLPIPHDEMRSDSIDEDYMKSGGRIEREQEQVKNESSMDDLGILDEEQQHELRVGDIFDEHDQNSISDEDHDQDDSDDGSRSSKRYFLLHLHHLNLFLFFIIISFLTMQTQNKLLRYE